MSLNKKKIVVFSGAGLDKESGVATFRDGDNAMWNNYKVDEVATPAGWKADREKVLRFYNERRQQMPEVLPNAAHTKLAELEKYFDVTNVTQNVSDLLERGGATNVIHLHGELTKARGSLYGHKSSPADSVYDIGYNDINIGDKCEVTGSQLRPHIVWFGEMPFGVDKAYKAIEEADILIIVGTSLQIGYTLPMLASFIKNKNTSDKIFYIDPEPMQYLDGYGYGINYINKGAVEGVAQLFDELTKIEKVL